MMPEPENGQQRYHIVKITMPRDNGADQTFLKIRIILSGGGKTLSLSEIESKAALLFKWLTTLIDHRVIKRFGELLSEHLKGQT